MALIFTRVIRCRWPLSDDDGVANPILCRGVTVGMPFAMPVDPVDQVAKANLPPLVELELDSPVVLARELEGQAFGIPVIKVADEVDALGPDGTGDLEGNDDFVFVC